MSLIINKMGMFLSIREKQDLMFKWSRENSLILAEEILKEWGKKEVPTIEVTYENFCQILNNISSEISRIFDKYNKSDKYTCTLSGYELSDYDKSVFINTLISSAAIIVTGNTFYTN